MKKMFCDFCKKEINGNEDDRHFQITKYSKNTHDFIVTNFGDFHKKCIDVIITNSRLDIKKLNVET